MSTPDLALALHRYLEATRLAVAAAQPVRRGGDAEVVCPAGKPIAHARAALCAG